MKAGIHPEYVAITCKCSCGNVINTFSTLGKDTLQQVRQGLDKWDYLHTAIILLITAAIYYRFW